MADQRVALQLGPRGQPAYEAIQEAAGIDEEP